VVRIYFKTSILIVVLLSSPLVRASTAVVLASRNGIAISADSKKTSVTGDYKKVGEGPTEKAILIQDRIVIFSIGVSGVHYDSFEYDFAAWVRHLQHNLPNNISVDNFAGVIKAESAKKFAGFADLAIKTGVFKRRNSYDTCTDFIQYVIAGYQGATPHIIVVHMETDWDNARLVGPKLSYVEPDGTDNAGYFRAYFFGIKDSISDVANRNSYAYEKAAAQSNAIERILLGEDVSLDEAVGLSRTLVGIEKKTNPSDVGGRVLSAKILPDGRAYNYPNDLAKPHAARPEKRKPERR
jgi:hypothetical protein